MLFRSLSDEALQRETATLQTVRAGYNKMTNVMHLSFEEYTGEIKYICGMLRECRMQASPPFTRAGTDTAMKKLGPKLEALRLEVEEMKQS